MNVSLIQFSVSLTLGHRLSYGKAVRPTETKINDRKCFHCMTHSFVNLRACFVYVRASFKARRTVTFKHA